MTLKTFTVPVALRLFQKIDFPRKYGLMDKFFGKRLSKAGICWIKTPLGLPWKLDLSMVTHRWIVYGSYDFQFLRWAKKNIPTDGVVVDSGANVGQMTLYFGKWFNTGKILAFEPSEEAANWVTECILKNNSSNIELIQKGLGEEISSAVLIQGGKERNENVHSFWSYISDISSAYGENITITRLDDELRNRNIDSVDLWKLDVEGFEIPALEGAKDLLQNQKIRAMYIELAIKDNNNTKIINYLLKYGYHCHYFDRKGNLYKPKKIADYQTDGLFLPA